VWDATLGQPSEIHDLLMAAWLRRKRLEARLIVGALGEALSRATAEKRESADNLLGQMGIAI
jgi:hypothetical protein